jgi:hypothetical protein
MAHFVLYAAAGTPWPLLLFFKTSCASTSCMLTRLTAYSVEENVWKIQVGDMTAVVCSSSCRSKKVGKTLEKDSDSWKIILLQILQKYSVFALYTWKQGMPSLVTWYAFGGSGANFLIFFLNVWYTLMNTHSVCSDWTSNKTDCKAAVSVKAAPERLLWTAEN